MLERNLLYTAVTRGRKLVVVIAEPKALAMAVRNRKATRRGTRLARRLAETEWAGRKEGEGDRL
jgi:exodeoxyribonuclease V alpha subunit